MSAFIPGIIIGIVLVLIISKLIYNVFLLFPSTVFIRYKPVLTLISIPVMFVFCGVSIFILLWGLYYHLNQYLLMLNFLIVGVSQGILLSLLIGIVANQIYVFKEKTRIKKMPTPFICTGLVTMLATINMNSQSWDNLYFRQNIINRLEYVSSLFENQLENFIKTGDLNTDHWYSQNLLEIAAYIRSLKTWVLTPMGYTRYKLINKLSSYVKFSLRGEWGNFDKCTPEKRSRSSYLSQIYNVLKIILIASLPFLLYLLIQRTELAFTQPSSDYMKAGSIIWALLTILSRLDPMFNQNISVIKDLNSIFPKSIQKKDNPKNSKV